MERFALPSIVDEFVVTIDLCEGLLHDKTPQATISWLSVVENVAIVERYVVINVDHSGESSYV